MASFKRYGLILMTTAASAALSACNGADNVASPGAGSVVIVQPTPTPTPTPGPTPTAPITAAQFAAATTQSGVTITADQQFTIVKAGTNNNVDGVGSTLNGVYPVSATSLTPAADPSTLNAFFTSTNYVGALNGPTDTAFQGWTCNSSTANFGGTSTSCTAVPAIGAGGATATCPTGTLDDGLVQTFRVCRLPQTITTDLSLPKIAGVVYRFRGQTEVGPETLGPSGGTGVTLTIAAGVVLAADSTESTNDLILVNRGSKISAIGTRDAPIIFTSQQNLVGNGVSDVTQGQWGGIILLGRSTTAVCASGTGSGGIPCQQAIEGVTGRFYGGTNEADSSGQMSYVQIRYTGIAITDGNELQGLTLGAAGSGTILDHIQSHNSADDGIEIFGGTANIKYFAVTGADDDGYDVDNGWRGYMQFIIAAQKVSGATADSFSTEIDSNGAEDLLPRTWGRYANFTFIETANAPAAIRLRGGADFTFVNGVVKTPSGVACVNMVAGEAPGGTPTTIRPANPDPLVQDQGPPVFNSIYFACQGR